jgi:3-oxoacyl-[acyl-carrier-protein] synthase II
MSGPRRVFISGVGPITTFGVGMDPLWAALVEGRSGIAPITRFDASGFGCPFAAEVSAETFNPRQWVPKSYRKAAKVMSRDIELAVGAAAAAIAEAGLTTRGTDPDAAPTLPPARVGCHIGAGLIAADVDELTAALVSSVGDDGAFSLARWGEAGMQNLTPLWMLKYLPNMLACHVTIIHDCQGPSNTITCAEASSGLSIGESMRVIERGDADCCLSGGAESKLNPMGLLRQEFAGRVAAASADVDPATIVRPFADDAAGSVVGEGGGILVLEAESSAHARGVRIHAEIAGFGAAHAAAFDGAGMDLDPAGEEISAAIEAALEDAGVPASQVDAIAPYGSGIAAVDAVERAGLTRVFADRIASIPLITTVPNVGNCAAGAGAIPLAVAAQCLTAQRLPARLNAGRVSGLDAGAAPSREAALKTILAISIGMGGQVAAVLLRRAS